MPNVTAEFRWIYKDTIGALGKLDRAVDRATMYGLRAAGRAVKQRARRKAPVGDASGSGTNSVDPHPGQLKASIRSNKQLKREGVHSYSVRVQPQGLAVKPYRAIEERDVGFMAAGHAEAIALMRSKFENSYRNTLRKWS